MGFPKSTIYPRQAKHDPHLKGIADAVVERTGVDSAERHHGAAGGDSGLANLGDVRVTMCPNGAYLCHR